MKDFISKVTFGFLMAQLVPGMVVIMAITCMTKIGGLETGSCIETMLKTIDERWFQSVFRTTAFLFLSCGIGMLIHALNWTVLAWIENESGQPVRETRHHVRPLWKQLATGPTAMITEVLSVLRAPNLTSLAMDENVDSLGRDSEWQFQFLQDFYLYFGQFYAHTAYASLVPMVLCIANVFRSPCARNLMHLVLAYFVTSILFLFGRVQLSSLFRAEGELSQTMNRTRTSHTQADHQAKSGADGGVAE